MVQVSCLGDRDEKTIEAGSVKCARERVVDRLSPQWSEVICDQDSIFLNHEISRLCPSPSLDVDRIQYPQGRINIALTKPSQWPLASSNATSKEENKSRIEQSIVEVVPRQTSAKPSMILSTVEPQRVNQYAPHSHHGLPYQYSNHFNPVFESRGGRGEINYNIAPPNAVVNCKKTSQSGTLNSSSRTSTSSSSVGSIPKFPAPYLPIIQPLPPLVRRSVNLGPPPSARRGASLYSSKSSYVTPIPEEGFDQEKYSHISHTLSHVLPTKWADGSPHFYMSDEEEGGDGCKRAGDLLSRAAEKDKLTGVVGSPSIGRQLRSALTTVKGSDPLDLGRDTRHSEKLALKSSRPTLVSRTAVVAGLVPAVEFTNSSMDHVHENDTLLGRTAFLDLHSPSEASSDTKKSNGELPSRSLPFSSDATVRPVFGSPVDPRIRQILGGLEKGGALMSSTPLPTATTPSENDDEGLLKQLFRVETSGGRVADLRGSLTSLPDLIRRATRLASNLDRGRTTSRLGKLETRSHCCEKSVPIGRPRSRSISHLLASFPPPGLCSTPTPTTSRGGSRWVSSSTNSCGCGASMSSPMAEKEHARAGTMRRCFGIPPWAFTFLIITLSLLVVAAVVIPISLIVIPRQNPQTATSTAVDDLTECSTSNHCANGGTSTISRNSCRCVCVNGFTGHSCDQIADNGCTVVNIGPGRQSFTKFDNATVGSAIPRLLESADANFSIPLDSVVLLSSFNSENLSCTAENALVTFNKKNKRRRIAAEAIQTQEVSYKLHDLDVPAPSRPTVSVGPRAPSHADLTNSGISLLAGPSNVFSSNGIVLAGTSAFPTVTSVILNIVTSSDNPLSTASLTKPIMKADFDFARVVVLFLLQEINLETAMIAQEKLQLVLSATTFRPGIVDIATGLIVDFGIGTVKLRNGTTVGGRGVD